MKRIVVFSHLVKKPVHLLMLVEATKNIIQLQSRKPPVLGPLQHPCGKPSNLDQTINLQRVHAIHSSFKFVRKFL